MNPTIDYYNSNADCFIEGTIYADVESIRKRFLKHIPVGGKILDLGCGSGRDTKEFMDAGYDVSAIDGSRELCKRASEYTGLDVKCMQFLELSEKETYDGVFACASLLHVPKEDVSNIVKHRIKKRQKDLSPKRAWN